MLDTRRHDSLFDKNSFTHDVHVIGVGGIGSAVVRQLAKLGVGTNNDFHVWDGDTVAPHNICNQAYDPADVGKLKVDAIAEHAADWGGGLRLIRHPIMVTEQIPFSGIVFLCVDSMAARKQICEQSLFRNPQMQFAIEPRMDASHGQVHSFDPCNEEHMKWWQYYLFSDNEAMDEVSCNGQLSVISTVEIVASIAVNQLIAYAREENAHASPNQVQLDLRSWELLAYYWYVYPQSDE